MQHCIVVADTCESFEWHVSSFSLFGPNKYLKQRDGTADNSRELPDTEVPQNRAANHHLFFAYYLFTVSCSILFCK